MHKVHLALSNRPEPEQLARRWFEYLLAGLVVTIAGILALMSSPDRAPRPVEHDEAPIGAPAKAPQPPAPGAATAPHDVAAR